MAEALRHAELFVRAGDVLDALVVKIKAQEAPAINESGIEAQLAHVRDQVYRLSDWLGGVPRAATRTSRFVRLVA
jgi:hypothetical protein